MKPYSIIAIFILSFFILSCEKKYKYIQIDTEESVLGGVSTQEKEAKIITAANDSIAYLEAYRNFCIAEKVNKDMLGALGKVYSTPLKFKLYNENGQDVANSVTFPGKENREEEIKKEVFALPNSVAESVDKITQDKLANTKKTAKIDSTKMKELLGSFRVKKDEFSNNNKKWYEPKSAPKYTNANGIYCYFQTENGIPSNLRFRVQYYADDWLFFKKILFSVDGKAYEYTPSNVETDSGDGGYIWEWFDEQLSSYDKDLIIALSSANEVKMKFIGRQYYNIKNLSAEQIKSIKRTLDLYHAMGGEF